MTEEEQAAKPIKKHGRQNSIESFDPRLLRILELGMYERVVIPGDTRPLPPSRDPEGNPVIDTRSLEERQRDAIRGLRYTANRLRTLRAVLIDAGDPRGELLWRTIVRDVDTRHLQLIVEPRDAQIARILSQVNMTDNKESKTALDDLAAALDGKE